MNLESPCKIESRKELEIWTEPVDFEKDRDEQEIDLINKKIEEYVRNPDNFLGAGGAGKVFALENQCIKLMKNRHNTKLAHMYDLGNTAKKEFEIQTRLNNFSHQEVYSPCTLRYYEGEIASAIVMEQLDAANMQLVINGQEELPDSFDLEDFFFRLESYISEMHYQTGIVHRDLEPRNIMIDKKTGRPRVIDFGRSAYFPENRKEEDFEKQTEADLENVTKVYEKLREHLDKIKK